MQIPADIKKYLMRNQPCMKGVISCVKGTGLNAVNKQGITDIDLNTRTYKKGSITLPIYIMVELWSSCLSL